VETEGQSEVQEQKKPPTLRSDLATLVKLRLNVFVLLTTFFGFLLAVKSGGGWGFGDLMLLVNTLIGTAAAAFGASVFNQLMEIKEDGRMERTADRPLPAKRMLPTSAFVIGWGLSAFGVIHLAATVSIEASYVAAITIGIYVFIYTPMKRRTSVNTLVGAIPGAFPPLIGWLGGGGGLWEIGGWYLFAVLFLWQLPHFVSINWLCREQYEMAGYVMWSDGDVSGARSAGLAAVFSVLLGVLAVVAPLPGLTGWIFGVVGLLAGLGLAALAMEFRRHGRRRAFRRFFLMTLLYLPVVFTVLAIDWN
jgi:protoheme IX farnesyltransferase